MAVQKLPQLGQNKRKKSKRKKFIVLAHLVQKLFQKERERRRRKWARFA